MMSQAIIKDGLTLSWYGLDRIRFVSLLGSLSFAVVIEHIETPWVSPSSVMGCHWSIDPPVVASTFSHGEYRGTVAPAKRPGTGARGILQLRWSFASDSLHG